MNLIPLIFIPILFIYEKKIRKDNTIHKKEVLIAFLLYNFFIFLIFYIMGILDSGYHLVDDHEVYTIGKDLTQYGIGRTLLEWLRRDLNIRFRFTYYIIRILQCVIFGTNFKVWHICYTFLASTSVFLSYLFARSMKCPMWLSYIYSILIFSGSQVAVLWRLGPQENLGTILLMTVFLCLLSYARKRTYFKLGLLLILTFFLGGIKEAFLVLLPILPVLLSYWQLKEEKENITLKKIIGKIKEDWLYTISTWGIFLVDMFIILFVVGTNKIGYAGIDISFGIKDYIRQIIWSCLVAFRVYFFSIIIGVILLLIPTIAVWLKSEKWKEKCWDFLFNICVLSYFMVTQFVLHAKSGMYERYMLPATIGFCLFWIVDLYHLVKDINKIKILYYLFSVGTIAAALSYVDIYDRGIQYAQDGSNLRQLTDKIIEYKTEDIIIVSAMEYELDSSISTFLQEEHGIEYVYNVFCTGYNNGIIKDSYLAKAGKESILFEEANMYVGYSEKIEPLMDERQMNISKYNRYDFGNYSLYVSKEIDQYHKSLLIVGDSIGEGAGSSDPSLKWYKYLIPYMKEKYGIDLEVTNVSMGGNSSYAGYVRTKKLEEKAGYDYIIVCYGENDAEEDFSLYYETLLRTIKEKYPYSVLMCILESSQREYTDKIKTIQRLCDYYGGYIVDTIEAFNRSDYTYDELCSDGTHPNDKGQEVYFETVRKVMDQNYQETLLTTIKNVKPVNKGVEAFEAFQYISKSSFEKVDHLKYRVSGDKLSGRLGIDYTTVKGNHGIKVYTGYDTIAEKNIVWENEFSLRYIEVLKDNFYAKEEIIIEFSSKEIFENMEGIIITG